MYANSHLIKLLWFAVIVERLEKKAIEETKLIAGIDDTTARKDNKSSAARLKCNITS